MTYSSCSGTGYCSSGRPGYESQADVREESSRNYEITPAAYMNGTQSYSAGNAPLNAEKNMYRIRTL